MLDSAVPDIPTNRSRQKIIERMVEERLTIGLEVAEVARLLAIVVLDVVEDDELPDLRLCRRRHVPNRHIDGFNEVRNLERSIRRAGLRRAVAAADDEVFFVVHLDIYYLIISHLPFAI